ASSMPAISNMMRPGLTTETQRSGAPLPLPIRVSAGFFVNGLSGKILIHNFPPRLMKRVMATRDASICRSVIQAASRAFNPYSPNAQSPPRQAFPVRRPRVCFLSFTFLGITIAIVSQTFPGLGHCCCRLAIPLFLLSSRDILALVHPALHANNPVGRVGLGETKIDVRAQRLQRQPALQIPLLA